MPSCGHRPLINFHICSLVHSEVSKPIAILWTQVASIREAGSKSLQKIAKDFGPEWAKEHLVPKVLALARNSHYLYRMTMLLALSLLASIVHHDVLVSQMLPVILSSAKDKVGVACQDPLPAFLACVHASRLLHRVSACPDE